PNKWSRVNATHMRRTCKKSHISSDDAYLQQLSVFLPVDVQREVERVRGRIERNADSDSRPGVGQFHAAGCAKRALFADADRRAICKCMQCRSFLQMIRHHVPRVPVE